MTDRIITLPLDSIQVDTRAQSRAEIDIVVVGEYAEDIKAGATFPPLVVFYDEKTYWLSEGFHRYHAYQQAEITHVRVVIKTGGLREAILQSLGSNADHGKRRTNADKRRAVEMMLKDAEWNDWPQAQIAKQCVVTPEYVSRLRKELSIDRSIDTPRTATRNGTTYTINTGNIGKKVEVEPPTVEDPVDVAPPPPVWVPPKSHYEDPPFDLEFEDEDGNPMPSPFNDAPQKPAEIDEIDDEEAQFLAALEAEAAALPDNAFDEAPPVAEVVTPRPLLVSDEELAQLKQEQFERSNFEANRAAFHNALNQLFYGAGIVYNPADCVDPTQWKGTWSAFERRYHHSIGEFRDRLTTLQQRIPFIFEMLESMRDE